MNGETTPPIGPLPWTTRAATVVFMVAVAFLGMLAANLALGFARGAELGNAPPPAALHTFSPQLDQQLQHAVASTLDRMQDAGTFTFCVLALLCTFGFVAAGRLLRPGMLPREGVRRALVMGTALLAFVCTAGGAEMAVLAHAVGAVVQHAPAPVIKGMDPAVLQQELQNAPTLMAVMVGVFTAPVAGLFAALSVYFDSLKVRELIAGEDRRLRGR